MAIKKNAGISLLVAVMFLLAVTTMFATPSYAATTTTEKFYFHVDPNSSYTVGSINTGGVIFNSTTLGLSSSGSTKSGTTSYNQNWYLSQLLAGGITISGSPQAALDLYASVASQWNYTIQIIEATSSGSTVGVLSQATCSGATGCLSLTTGQVLYTIPSFSSISSTNIPSGDELQVSISISESSGTNSVNLVAENSNPSLTSYFTLPLSSPAVTVNSLALSINYVQGPGTTAAATLSVSDAFGLYDVASHTIQVSIPGTSATPISSTAMTPSSSNTPTSYTGTYTYSIDPSSTSYAGFAGIWSAQSSVTDNSGNAYTSTAVTFNYSPGGSCIACTSTTHTTSHTIFSFNWSLTPLETIIVALVVILVAVAVVAVIR